MASRIKSQIPDEILNNHFLNESIKILPANYNFEIHKTVWKIKSLQAKNVALQFPEGLLLYSCLIADILQEFTGCETVILADVTYGACCVDDFTAKALNCDLMVHYGHSCLVPIQDTKGIQMLYIFVDIKFDTGHLIDTLLANFEKELNVVLFSTIQFVGALQIVARILKEKGYANVSIPQTKPLSPGEILGCTAPKILDDRGRVPDALIYVGDGRFHLEAAMVANPSLAAYRYDPYAKEITQEYYDYDKMTKIRFESIEKAKKASTFGLVLGALGRQGNPKIFDFLKNKLESNGRRVILVVLSEIFPAKLKLFDDNHSEHKIDCWIQVACPRLSIDWGVHFGTPLLTPYEAAVLLKEIQWQVQYPMDFYATNSLGPWTNKHPSNMPQNALLVKRRVKIESTN